MLPPQQQLTRGWFTPPEVNENTSRDSVGEKLGRVLTQRLVRHAQLELGHDSFVRPKMFSASMPM